MRFLAVISFALPLAAQHGRYLNESQNPAIGNPTAIAAGAKSEIVSSFTSLMFAMRCFGALLSVYVRDVLASTSAAFGVLNTLIGVGMIVGTQLLTRFTRHVPQQNLFVYGLGGMGVAVLITALFGTMASTAAGTSATGC